MQCLDQAQVELLHACASTKPNLIKRYIEQGVSPCTYDENRTSPLHIAAQYGSYEVAEELIDQGCLLDITDCAGWTPLHVATYRRRPELVQLLLDKGADAGIVNTKGETPYDLAKDEPMKKVFSEYWQRKSLAEVAPGSPVAQHNATLQPQQAFCERASPLKGPKQASEWRVLGALPQFALSSEILVERGRRIFNQNPHKGVTYFLVIGAVKQEPTHVAHFLRQLAELRRRELGEFLSSPAAFNQAVLHCFVQQLGLSSLDLLPALQKLLHAVELPRQGASQVLAVFAEEYWSADSAYASPADVHSLACSLVMLDFALHGAASVSEEEFVQSLDYPRRFLARLYAAVQAKSLRTECRVRRERLFSPGTTSGFLAYETGSEWKERYFMLKDGVLWFFSSAAQLTPYGLIPLKGITVTFDTRLLTFSLYLRTGFRIIKFKDSGEARVQQTVTMNCKAGNLNLWLNAFKGVPQINFKTLHNVLD